MLSRENGAEVVIRHTIYGFVGTIPSEHVEYSTQVDRHFPCLDPFISPHAVTYGYTNAWQDYKSSAETIACS